MTVPSHAALGEQIEVLNGPCRGMTATVVGFAHANYIVDGPELSGYVKFRDAKRLAPTTYGCGTCGTRWTAPVTACPKGPHDPTQRDSRVQQLIDDPEAYFANVRARVLAHPSGLLGWDRFVARELEPEVCRCGRRASDAWTCFDPDRPPWRCRLGWHRWGITTWPINVRWCQRCGQKGYAA